MEMVAFVLESWTAEGREWHRQEPLDAELLLRRRFVPSESLFIELMAA